MTLYDLKQLNFLYKEIDRLKYKIDNYKPAEIVVDSVRASSAMFPYVEHTVTIEGIEQNHYSLPDLQDKLYSFRKRLANQILYIEDEIILLLKTMWEEFNRLEDIEDKMFTKYISKDIIRNFIKEELPDDEIMKCCENFDENGVYLRKKLEELLGE